MAPHSSTLAWKIPWTEDPGGLQSIGSLRVGHDWATSLFTFMHWRRKWQPTPVFLPGESQGRRSLVGCSPWGRTESDTTEATWQQAAPSGDFWNFFSYNLGFFLSCFCVHPIWFFCTHFSFSPWSFKCGDSLNFWSQNIFFPSIPSRFRPLLALLKAAFLHHHV